MKFSDFEQRLRMPVIILHGQNFNLVNFGLFAAAGATLGYSVCFFYLHTRGIAVGQICWTIAIVLNLFNLLFAKLFGAFSVGIPRYFRSFWHFFNQTTFYHQGGMIGALIGSVVLCLFLEIPLILIGDAVCLGGIVIMWMGRIGCHHYGCCTGRPTRSRFSIFYNDPESRICNDYPLLQNTPLIPVQLISSAINLLIFIVCCLIVIYKPVVGLIFVVFIAGVNLKRILIQRFRLKRTGNKIPYRLVAMYIFLSAVIIMSLFYFTGASYFQLENPLPKFTFSNYFRFLISDPAIPASLIFVALINFAAFGIHGRKIGTHTNFAV
jgi:hypothetical protein